ncbi:unnamed protein product, partial [marine sediment metagenome]
IFYCAGVWIEQELATASVDAAMIATDAVDTAEIKAGAVDTEELATGAVTPSKVNIPGFVQRPTFTWNADSTFVYISPFIYDHQGTTNQLVYSHSSINYQFGSGGSNSDSTNLAGGDWFYLYIDDSAVDTAGTNLIAVAQLLAVAEEPVKSEAKHGRYGSAAAGNATADDRCIGAFRTGATPGILEFFHEGDLCLFADAIEVLSATVISTTWIDVTFIAPCFATKIEMNIEGVYDNANTTVFWRTNGQTGGTGHRIGIIHTDAPRLSLQIQVISDSSQMIELISADATTNTLDVNIDGWRFPIGM